MYLYHWWHDARQLDEMRSPIINSRKKTETKIEEEKMIVSHNRGKCWGRSSLPITLIDILFGYCSIFYLGYHKNIGFKNNFGVNLTRRYPEKKKFNNCWTGIVLCIIDTILKFITSTASRSQPFNEKYRCSCLPRFMRWKWEELFDFLPLSLYAHKL